VIGVWVLVVDDNSFVREGLRFILTHAGMEVVDASTRCQAMQVAAAGLRESHFH
jgi:CheY-like chemotaxis protein